MLSLKKIWELVQGANLNDAYEIPVSEGVGTGKTKRYNIGQLKAFISAYILQQISGITKGDTGAQGATGAQGMQGEKGEKGDKGDAGVQGLKGDQGLQGPIGIQGPIGAKGDKGDTGAQGVQGIKGDKGDQGDQGDKGDTGADGSDGVNHYLGTFPTFAALTSAHPVATDGDEAIVDEGVGTNAVKYIWDGTDSVWVSGGGSGASSFAEIAGNGRDNPSLNTEFTQIDNNFSQISSDQITLSIFKVSNYGTL